MPQLFTPPFQTTFDANGAPISGAKLAFYVTGTTVPASVYANAGLTVSLGSVLTADAAGRFPPIYLDPAIVYRVIVSDAGGTPIRDVDPVGDSLLSSLAGGAGASLIGYQPPGTGALAETVQAALARELWVEQFGASPSASASVNVAAFRAALLAASAFQGTVRIGRGGFNLEAATIGGTGLVIPAGVQIKGSGKEATTLTVTGTADAYLFRITNSSRIAVEDVGMVGNGVASGSGPGCAIFMYQSPSASAYMEDIAIRRCRFENFKADNWVSVYNENPTWAVSRVHVEDCLWISRSGNARNGANTGVPSACLSFSCGNTAAKMYDFRVTGNTAYCDYIKSFCLTWAGATRFDIWDNDVIGAGTDASISDDAGSYAFMSYNGFGTTSRPSRISYKRNRVFGVRDCGIYVTDVDGVEIDDFYFEGQTSTVDDTLPKGGIALNATLRATITNVRAGGGNARGIGLAGGNGGEFWDFADIDLGDACQQPIKYGSVAKPARVRFDGLVAHATAGRGIFLVVTSTTAPDRLEVANFDVRGTTAAAIGVGVTGTPTFKRWRFANGRAGDFGLGLSNLGDGASPVIVENVTFEDNWSGASISLNVVNSKNVRLKNLHFVGSPPLYHLSTSGAEGTVEGATFSGTIAGKMMEGSSTLGRLLPTWTGSPGDFVQNANGPSEAGGTNTKYVLNGWRYTTGTTWVAERTPTQNNTATV